MPRLHTTTRPSRSARRTMPLVTVPFVTAAALAATLLAGCSQAEDAARSAASGAAAKASAAASGAASGAASRAADTLKRKAQAEAIRQVCGLTTGSGPFADGKVADGDRALAASAAAAAEQAGIAKEYTEPLATLGDSRAGQAATADAVSALKLACGRQGRR